MPSSLGTVNGPGDIGQRTFGADLCFPAGHLGADPMEPGASWRGAMMLLHYNGEGPPEACLIQVQMAAQLNAWLVEEMAVQVSFALEGKALLVLTDL